MVVVRDRGGRNSHVPAENLLSFMIFFHSFSHFLFSVRICFCVAFAIAT